MNLKAQPIIRVAKPGDEAGIHDAHMRSIREVCVKDHGPEEIKGWGNRELGDRWIEPIKEHHVWILQKNGVIEGYAFMRIYENEDNKHSHIHGLYLTPTVLGQGFGKILMEMMLEKAKISKVSVIRLFSSITAHEFYKSFGFIDTEPKKTLEIGGYPVTSYPMSLETSDV
ncbi:MAG: GNAT family N-acetyltransferase [Bdellovibrionaceae bacterium]|nr:GNAT family N-acetyltransferase [Pseudobdellovibrionaceae bacterium]